MDPEKEGRYLLRHLIDTWDYYTDRWMFSCTWSGEAYSWRLIAEHPDPHDRNERVRVMAVVTREEWSERHHDAVDDAADEMYLQTFEERSVVR